jgi:transposase
MTKYKDQDLRDRAIQMYNKGKNSAEIGKVLKVPPTTVAAWLAHYTRGTYEGSGSAAAYQAWETRRANAKAKTSKVVVIDEPHKPATRTKATRAELKMMQRIIDEPHKLSASRRERCAKEFVKNAGWRGTVKP